MNPFTRMMFKLLFCLEIGLFAWTYLFGVQGIHAVLMMERGDKQLKNSVENLKGEIKELEESIMLWKTNPFYKEKRAREQLQMVGKDESVFIEI